MDHVSHVHLDLLDCCIFKPYKGVLKMRILE